MAERFNEMEVRKDGTTLIIEKVLDAPPTLVFDMYANRDHLESWWGPKGWDTTIKTFEFKPEGIWHYCMTCTDRNQGDFYGQQSWGKAIYQEIQEPHKIVYTDVFSDEEGHTNDQLPEMRIVMKFLPLDQQTKLISESEFSSVEELDKVLEMGMIEGVASQYERLEEYLSEQ